MAKQPTKLFTLAFKAEYMRRQGNIYNRPLPELLTSLVLDWSINPDPKLVRAVRYLKLNETVSDEIDIFGLTYSITRTR